MKIATSYFAQIRNFKPYMIPVSTAKWSPKWFKKDKLFVDHNGVLNGIECKLLAPGDDLCGLCNGKDKCNKIPSNCEFLSRYRNQLFNTPISLLIDFIDKVKFAFEKSYRISERNLIIVFMVYESLDNPCSERSAIQDYLRIIGNIDCNELILN